MLLAVAACTRGPGATRLEERATAHEHGSATAAPASASQPAAPSASADLPRIVDGCFVDIDLDAGSQAVLEQAGALCLAGMVRLVTTPAAEQDAASSAVAFRIDDPTRCLRVIASGAASVRALELSIVDAAGKRLATELRDLPLALAPAHGPLCVGAAGVFRATARVTRGSGRVALAVWQAKGE